MFSRKNALDKVLFGSLHFKKKTKGKYTRVSAWISIIMYMDNLLNYYSPPRCSLPLQRNLGQQDHSSWSRPGTCISLDSVKIEWYRAINIYSVWLNIYIVWKINRKSHHRTDILFNIMCAFPACRHIGFYCFQ